MKKETKIVIGVISAAVILIGIILYLFIKVFNGNSFIGTWYKKGIYTDDEVSILLDIKRNGTLQIKTKFIKNDETNIKNGTWKKDEDDKNCIIVTVTNEDETYFLYLKKNHSLCIDDKECEDNLKYHKKGLFSFIGKEYVYTFDYDFDNWTGSYNYWSDYDWNDDWDDYNWDDEDYDLDELFPITTKSNTYTFDSDYDEIEDKDKVPIIIFYGDNCTHCIELFEALDNLDSSIKDTIVVRMYEVWSNETNSRYMNTISNYLGDDVPGVPYIIIGDQAWIGFNQNYLPEMIEVIKSTPTIDITKVITKE